MSADLLYAATRKFNSFVRVRDGVRLSAEPNNLLNKATFNQSGLVNAKTVGVTGVASGGVVVTLKTKNGAQKPAKSTRSITLKTTSAKNASKVVEQLVGNEYYRRDLKRAALARVSKVILAQQRAAKQKAGTLNITYGRNSRNPTKVSKNKRFDFAQKTANKKNRNALSASEMMDLEEQELIAQAAQGGFNAAAAPSADEEDDAPPALAQDVDEIPAPA